MYVDKRAEASPSSSFSVVSSQPSGSHSLHYKQLPLSDHMFKRNVFTDVICLVEGQVFKAHRALLASMSPFLEKKLCSADGKSLVIKIPKIGASEFEILLHYMYTGILDLDCHIFFDVYRATSILDMEVARQECLKVLEQTEDEIKGLFYNYVVAKKLGRLECEVYQEKFFKLITHRFEETALSSHFMKLPVSYVSELLSAQTIGARSEIIVFLSALNWLNFDFGNRSVYAVKVMECVRFSAMTMAEVIACCNPLFLPEVMKIPEIVAMLRKSISYIAAKQEGQEAWFVQYARPKRHLMFENLPMKLWNQPPSPPAADERWEMSTPNHYKPHSSSMTKKIDAGTQTPKEKVIAANEEVGEIRLDGRELAVKCTSSCAENFLPISQTVIQIRQLSPIEECGGAESDATGKDEFLISPERAKVLYLRRHQETDGRQTAKDNVSKIPAAESKSERGFRPKMHLRLDKASTKKEVERDNDMLLLIGGINPEEKDIGSSVSIFDNETESWQLLNHLSEPRHNHCSVVMSNYLYVSGGCDVKETLEKNRPTAKRSCFRLNLKDRKWSTISDMMFCRSDHSMVVCNGQIYVLGGEDEDNKFLKSIEVYDPHTKHWRNLHRSPLCCGRKGMGVAVFRDKIWVVGGLIETVKDGRHQVVSHVDYYEPMEKRWHYNIYTLPRPLCFCSLIVWNEKFYCMGGLVLTKDGVTKATDEVWFMEEESCLWNKGPSLSEAKMAGTAMIQGDNLLFLGGHDPEYETTSCVVSVLKPGSSSWETGIPLPPHAYATGLSAATFSYNK